MQTGWLSGRREKDVIASRPAATIAVNRLNKILDFSTFDAIAADRPSRPSKSRSYDMTLFFLFGHPRTDGCEPIRDDEIGVVRSVGCPARCDRDLCHGSGGVS